MSKKTKSETVEVKSEKIEVVEKNVTAEENGGYNPESWPEEWSRKKKESEKSKGYPGPADILPACDTEGDNAETE